MAGNRRINQNQIALNVSPNVITAASLAGGTLIKAYSPTVTATEVDDGFQITITDVNGTRTIMVHHGYQGEQGDKGDPGFSPEVSLTATDSGVNMTIVDESGEHTILIPKGDQGDPGMSPIIQDGYWYLYDNTTNQYINSGITAQKEYQFDDEPTEDSDSLLTSGAVYTALESKADIADVPTKVSDLDNDAGYLTQHQDISGKANVADVPTKVSDLDNDSGFISSYTETDPTVPAWAKSPTKPTYTASEVGALPSNTVIPSKVSDLTNDAGYLTSHQDISGKADASDIPTKLSDLTNDVGFITSYTEIDPTVPAWARAATKPSYTAQEVGALPSDTVIPTKTSDLTNDSGFITSYTETDPTVPAWAKAANKPSYTAQEIGALPDSTVIPTKVSDLTNDAGYLTAHQDISGKADIANVPTKVSDLVDDSGHYTKPNGGIPASDLASGVIPDLTDYVQKTDYATASTAGVVKVNPDYGIYMMNNQLAVIRPAYSSEIKAGLSGYLPIVANRTAHATFYGLAKAAGDTTQAASSNAVGTYTEDAKNAIKAMLDVGTLPETVTGSTPVITATTNHRYICGEVTSLNFTPCASGMCDVRFTSGSTVTVLTVPNTVKWPGWFDPASLETNTVYEINIEDGVYGVVMTWPV